MSQSTQESSKDGEARIVDSLRVVNPLLARSRSYNMDVDDDDKTPSQQLQELEDDMKEMTTEGGKFKKNASSTPLSTSLPSTREEVEKMECELR